MTSNDKATATVLLKDARTTYVGSYRIKVTHLAKYTARALVGLIIVGGGLALSYFLGGPGWLTDILLYQTGWLALEVIAGVGLLAKS